MIHLSISSSVGLATPSAIGTMAMENVVLAERPKQIGDGQTSWALPSPLYYLWREKFGLRYTQKKTTNKMSVAIRGFEIFKLPASYKGAQIVFVGKHIDCFSLGNSRLADWLLEIWALLN